MAEYEANALALRARTEKLRQARLAREASEPPPEPKKAKKSAAKGKTASKAKTASKSPPGKLADWLDERSKSGHST